MRAIQVDHQGGPEVLAVTELPDPVPGPGQVLVRLAAIGVNFVEVNQRSGAYPRPVPFVPGSEGAGQVVAVGDGVDPALVGTRVASTSLAGSYAELALAPADRVVPVPDAVPDDVAGGALLQGMTAHYLVSDSYPVQPGDAVLVHAAAGGVGLLITQLATALGARVIGTVSTPEKAATARAAGAAGTLGYEGFAAAVRELTGGSGVPAVYDGVGRTTFDESLASLRRRGILVLYGQSSGPVPPFDLSRLQSGGSLAVTRPTMGDFIVTPEALAARAGAVLDRIVAGALTIRIGGRYPLAGAAQAHEDLAARRTTGKLVLTP
jgi:NADPH2:quinone reductase